MQEQERETRERGKRKRGKSKMQEARGKKQEAVLKDRIGQAKQGRSRG
jgi:hypothetical protein